MIVTVATIFGSGDVFQVHGHRPSMGPRSRGHIRKGFGFIIILFAVVLMFSGTTVYAAGKAPDFKLKDTDGNNWTLRQFEGKKPVVIDLMSIPCDSCKKVEANLEEIYPDYKDDVFIISVDVWAHIDTEDDLRKYKEDHEVPWPMALDTDDMLTKYAASEIAKVVIVDMKGYAIFEKTGVTTEEEFREYLDKALEGKGDPIDINPVSIWALAIFAGVASFFSPCAFPMFPGYMTFYLKKHMEQKEEKLNIMKAAGSGSVTALGIIVVYIVIGGLVLALGQLVIPYVTGLKLIIGAILVILGALMMTNIQYDRIISPFRKLGAKLKGQKKAGADTSKKGDGFYGGLFLYGAGYGGAAAACTLPVFLAVILTGIATGNIFTGILLLICYTMVAAGLMIGVTIALAVVGHKAVQKISQYTNVIKKISGLVLIIAGIYLLLLWAQSAGYIVLPWG